MTDDKPLYINQFHGPDNPVYQFQARSWENDADDYRTVITDNLSANDVKFLVALGNEFRSCHSQPKGMGNEGHSEEDLRAVVDRIAKQYPIDNQQMLEAFSPDYDVYEAITEYLLGEPVSDVYAYDFTNFCRVFESFKVFQVPVALIDCTEEFTP